MFGDIAAQLFKSRRAVAARAPAAPPRAHFGELVLWRLLNRVAQSAVKTKGSVFDVTFNRLLPKKG
jgi:hypothetical protein